MTATLHEIKPATAPIDLLWPEYPKRLTERGAWVRVGKARARDALDKLLKQGESLDHIIAAAKQYRSRQDPRYVRDCVRWLRDRDFEDYEPEQEAEIIPITSDEQRWQDIKATMKGWIGTANYRSWIAPLKLVDVDATGMVSLAAPSEYHRDWVAREYQGRLGNLWGRPVAVIHGRDG